MFRELFSFELSYYVRKPFFWITILAFFVAGFAGGSSTGFTFPNIYKNSSYEIAYLTGILSLLAIFPATLLVASSMLRESDSRFAHIIFATPVNRKMYLLLRLLSIMLFSFLAFIPATAGIFAGNLFSAMPADKIGPYHPGYYMSPLLLIALPNILFCTAILTSVAWIGRNKLMVYVTGLALYILYIIASIFSNSPLIAGSAPATAEQLALFAKLDPFGLAAFFEQTRYWTAAERNVTLLSLSGNLLLNRVIWVLVAAGASVASGFVFNPTQISSARKLRTVKGAAYIPKPVSLPSLHIHSWTHHFRAFRSYLRMDLFSLLKGIPFIIVILLWTGLMGVELFNAINADPRLGANFATSGLFVSVIMESIPVFALLVLLFFSSELLWKAKASGFESLEQSTPVHPTALFISKLCTVSFIALFLVVYSCVVAIIVQLVSGSQWIDSGLYLSLLYYIGLPLVLSAVLAISIQILIKNRYAGLAIASVILLVLNTRIAEMIGIGNALVTFGKTFRTAYHDMNGFGSYPAAFHVKMLFNVSAAILLVIITGAWYRGKSFQPKTPGSLVIVCLVFLTLSSGAYLSYHLFVTPDSAKAAAENDWKEAYERKFKSYAQLHRPTIVDVRAEVDLYPTSQRYEVSGSYNLVNKTAQSLDTLLVYVPAEARVQSLSIPGAKLIRQASEFHHYFFLLDQSLTPGDSLLMQFSFTSSWSPFRGHTAFNSIIENGSFIRISRYFPSFGYQDGNEITNSIERKKRKLHEQLPLKSLESPAASPYDYGFINLSMTVSTEGDQTAIASGDLRKQWTDKGRKYFHYTSDRPIPFRFAVSSARYKVERSIYRNIPIEVYYDARHSANVTKLITSAQETLAYCERNFSPYPHKVIRFAEISAFAEGFAATAYPGVIYMKENGGFYTDLSSTSGQDVINGLAGHELSHQWWGSSQIAPEYKEGSWILSETLANYTALMLYKNTYGAEAALDIVKQHLDVYLSSRGYSKETALYKTSFDAPHLAYNKGLVVMHQLQLLIGEEAVNSALSSILKAHAYPKDPPSAEHLVQAFLRVSPVALHAQVNELFKEVTVYDTKLETANASQLQAGLYQLSINGVVSKYKEDPQGVKASVPVNTTEQVAIYTTDKKWVYQTVPVVNNRISATLTLNVKPVVVKLDPTIRHIDYDINDNEKQVTLVGTELKYYSHNH